MRILLNLLPPEEKIGLASRFRFRFFLWQTILLFSLEVYIVLVFGMVYVILNYQVETDRQALAAFGQYSEETKKLSEYQEKFKAVNAEIESVWKYESAHLRWSALFSILNRLVPKGVVIVDFSTKDYLVSLVGQAETREHFLNFESALKAESCVSDVRVPISNLFLQKEVEFQIDFRIHKECLH